MTLESFGSISHGPLAHENITISDGSNTLIAAVTGKRIVVHRFMLSGDSVVSYELRSGSNKIFTFYGNANFGVPLSAGHEQIPIFITNVGEALMLVASGSVSANVYLHYKLKRKGD